MPNRHAQHAAWTEEWAERQADLRVLVVHMGDVSQSLVDV